MEGSPLINIQVQKGHHPCVLKLSLVHGLEPTHERLSVERSLLLNVETEPILTFYPTSYLCVVSHFLIFFIFMQFSAKIMQHSEILRFRTITNSSFLQRNRTFYCRKKCRNFDCTAGKSLYVEHF